MDTSTKRVFDDHLRLKMMGFIEEDIANNYSENAVIISPQGKFFGHDGIRESAEILKREIGENAEFEYIKTDTGAELAYLIWKSKSKEKIVEYGVDSFLIKNDKIEIQSTFFVLGQANT